jgi:Flp pilus assembly protein TadG
VTRVRSLHLRDERGVALVMAMLVLVVLAIALTSIIYFTSSNERTSNYQKASQVARSLAEAGVNNAISIVSNPANANYLLNDGVHTPTTLLPDQAHAYTSTYPGGTVTWWGTFDWAHLVWTLSATSTVDNPTGPNAADIHKTMTAKIQVHLPTPKALTLGVWNWIYSPKAGSGGCDTQFDNSVTIQVPVWIGGNACLRNTVKVQRPIYVGGWLNNGTSQAAVGSNSTPVSEAYVGAGCWYLNNPTYNPCRVDAGSVKTNVWASNLYTTLASIPPSSVFNGISAPPICWGPGDCAGDPVGGWYSVASPGPKHPCEVASTSPAGNALPVFETPGDTLVNESVPGVFNLTPDAYDYTCKTASGELSWNRTTRTLTAQGIIYIDGSVTVTSSGNQPVVYKGWGNAPSGACTSDGSCQAVLFLSGTFLNRGEHLCAVAGANDCDSNGWDPNKKLLIVLTRGQGGQLPVGDGVNVITNGATFQGGLYARYRIVTGQGGWVQGPLVSGTETVVVGQSTTLAFPPLHIAPLAIQQPPGAFWIDAPYDFTG